MSQFYAGQNVSTCTKDPYAQAKASLQRAASKEEYYRSRFYKIPSGRRDDYDTESLYGDLKELQQQSGNGIYGLWSTIEI